MGVILYQGSNGILKELKSIIMGSYAYSSQLKQITSHLNDIFRKNDVLFLDTKGKEVKCSSYLNISSSNYKTEGQQLQLAMFLSDYRNIFWYVSQMPDSVKEIYETLILKSRVKEKWVNEHTNELLYVETGRWYKEFGGWFCWLRGYQYSIGEKYSWNFEKYVGLEPFVCKKFVPAFIPSSVTLKTLQELPSKEKLKTMNLEPVIQANYMLIQGLYLQGAIMPGKTKLVMKSSLKKLEALHLAEFFPEAKDDEIRLLRTKMLAQAVGIYTELMGSPKTVPSFEVQVITLLSYLGNNGYSNQIFLPYIQGFKGKDDVYDEELVTFANNFLDNCDSDKWYSTNDFLNHSLLHGIKNIFPAQYVMYLAQDYNYKNAYTGKLILPDSICHELGFSFLNAYLFFLASLGILEIAYDEKVSPRKYSSPFDAIKYFRLSKLGLFIYGKVEEYFPSVNQDDTVYFELDPQRLIVRNIVDNNPYANLLDDVAHYIGGNRYEVSSSSFLAHCSSKSDVEQKISIFKRFISNELPQVWATFFEDMLQHCNPLSNVKQREYKLFTIDANNRKLMKLIVSDPVLRKICVRAENHLLLVKQDDLKTFEKQMKSLGYLL